MKLLSMHVDNFGGLHNYDYTFDEGLNVVLHDNGWGKTTMAAYLKAMLYGYDSKRSRDITENERKRYIPWQGGSYGGSLDFEAGGVHYRITRTFGESPRFDKVKIINADTKVTARIDPDRIGETLFCLDASAFQRSVYIHQNGMLIDDASSSIHTRLNALVSQANDLSVYDGAIEKLTAQTKIYEKIGGRGQIAEIGRQISTLEQKRDQFEIDIRKQDDARERISQIDEILERLNTDLDQKKKKLDELSGEAKKQETTLKLLEDTNRQIVELQGIMNNIQRELGGSIPSQNVIDVVKQRKQEIDRLNLQIIEIEAKCGKLSTDYATLLKKYNGTLPDVNQLDEIQRANGELRGMKTADAEETFNQCPTPEAYERINDAREKDRDYVNKLQITINSQMTLQQFIQRLEVNERNIQQENETWSEKKRQYNELSTETSRLQNEAEGQKRFNPMFAEADISKLDSLQKRQELLERKISEQQDAVEREKIDWIGKKNRYLTLRNEVDVLRVEAENKGKYVSAKAEPVMKKLEEMQQCRQAADMKCALLASAALTAEQEEILSANAGKMLDTEEASAILKKHHNILSRRADIQGLEARTEGEKAKKESIRTAMAQLGAEKNITPVEEPQKNSGSTMIGVGVVFAVIGLILAIAVSPLLAIAAVVGAILAVLGYSQKNAYQTKLQEYEAYKEEKRKQKEIVDQKTNLQKQIDTLEETIGELEKKISNQKQYLDSDEAVVKKWMMEWAPDATDVNEEVISKFINRANEVRKLRDRKQQIMELQACLEEQENSILEYQASVEAAYPELTGKTVAEALKWLRSAETEQRVTTEKLNAATKNLNQFLKEAKLAESQLQAEESPIMDELLATLKRTGEEIEKLPAERAAVDSRYPEIEGMLVHDAISFLQSGITTYKILDGQYQTAMKKIKKFIADVNVNPKQFDGAVSPRAEKLMKEREQLQSEMALIYKAAKDVLATLGLNLSMDHLQLEFRKAEQMLIEYQQFTDKLQEKEQRRNVRQQQIENGQRKLKEKMFVLQNQYPDKTLDERLRLIREDIAEANVEKQTLGEIERKRQKLKNDLHGAERAVNEFISEHMHFQSETQDALNEIFEKVKAYEAKKSEIRPLREQSDTIQRQNGMARNQFGTEVTALRNQISDLENRRDNLREEYTKKSDQIRQADQSLEQYPDVVTEIRQLYEQKKKAQSTLNMLKKAIQVLSKAKENLADRYLGKVEQMFNRYMQIWLKNDAIKGILDIDFKISIQEKDKTHVAQGYSTGYCDMIDFCMRLALVDTLFESEKPFLILDDPFVNLDAERLKKALELLNAMSANKQIVYFVCHPIRALDGSENSSSREEFVRLAELTRKSIESRKNIGTEIRKLPQKDPRLFYKIVSTGNSLAIRPAKLNYTITNSIFGMNFVVNETELIKDIAYELFFIDAKGRVLNDRQMVEIKNGKISTERVQFCLNTRDDSGTQYELMIREMGQDDFDVLARIPFNAKLAFAGTDSFDF